MGRNILALALFILGPLGALLLLDALLQSGGRRRTARRHPGSLGAATALLAGAIFLFWALGMAALTYVTAAQLFQRMMAQGPRFITYVEECCALPDYYDPARSSEGKLWRQYASPEEFRASLREGVRLASDFRLYEAGRRCLYSGLLRTPEPVFETAVLFLDGEGRLLWDGDVSLLENPAAHALTVRGPKGKRCRFDSPAALLRACYTEDFSLSYGSDLRSVILQSVRYYRDDRDPAAWKTDLILNTLVVAHPLRSAVKLLWPCYLSSALLGLGLTLLLRRSLRKRLLAPLGDLLDGMGKGWYNLHAPTPSDPIWREAAALLTRYGEEQDHRRYLENERTRLEKALDYAKAAEEERRQLTSSLAHELKTPLAVVHSYAEGLKARIAEDKREKYLDTLLGETERMDALVMALLDLSRLEAGRVRLSRDDFDLRALAADSMEKLRPLAAQRGMTLALLPGDACPVTADEGRIAQAAENLLVNALRYAPAGSRVQVGVEKAGGRAVLRVLNPVEKPFTPEELTKLWEPFWRRDKARFGPGTGLGLPIVRQIAELHGGRSKVRNTEGGVEFTIELPV